jgi:signal peptidase II
MTQTPDNNPRESPSRSPAESGLRPFVFYLIVLIVFAADQASKAWIRKTIGFEESREILGKNFLLTLTHNTGGAWGLLPHGNPLFIGFAIVAAVALLFAYHRVARPDSLIAGAFALALGGAFGNLLDRLRFGYVVDFFDARFIHWPIFNVADSAISLSIVLLLIHFFRSAKTDVEETTPTAQRTAE